MKDPGTLIGGIDVQCRTVGNCDAVRVELNVRRCEECMVDVQLVRSGGAIQVKWNGLLWIRGKTLGV